MDDIKYWQQLAQTFELAINEQKRMVGRGGKIVERLRDMLAGSA